MEKQRARGACLAFLLVTAACAGDAELDASGTVTDSFRGIPVEGITVALYREECLGGGIFEDCGYLMTSTSTDPDGRYDLSVQYDPDGQTPVRLVFESIDVPLRRTYETREESIADRGSRFELDVELAPRTVHSVAGLEATTVEGTTDVELTWTEESEIWTTSVLVVRREGASDFTDPEPGTELEAGEALGGATVLYAGPKDALATGASGGSVSYALLDETGASEAELSYAVWAYDDYFFYSVARTDTVTTEDLLPPDDVTNLAVTVEGPSGSRIVRLTWLNPVDDFYGTLILRSTRTPVSDVPIDGERYDRDDMLGSALVRLDTSGAELPDVDVTDGTTYHYRVFAHDEAYNYAAGVAIEVTP